LKTKRDEVRFYPPPSLMKKHLKKLKTSFKKINYRILRTTHLVIFGLGIFSLVCLIFLETKKGYASSTTDYGYKIKKE